MQRSFASIPQYLATYTDFIEQMRVDVDDFIATGVMRRAQELNAGRGRRIFNDNDTPMFFVGDLDASLVLIHLNQKQADKPPELRTKPGFSTTEEYFEQFRRFGANKYGPSSDGTHKSPFDHKQIRFLRPFEVIDFVDERLGNRRDRLTNLERAIDRKLQLELIPYGSDSFSAADFVRRPALLQPHLDRVTNVIAARPRRYVIFCGAVFAPLLARYVVEEHRFGLIRTGCRPTRGSYRFANLVIPHATQPIDAGLAHSWATQGLPMTAYAREVHRRYARE